MFNIKTGTALKDLIEAQGNKGTLRVIQEGIKDNKIKPEDFSLAEIWYACEGGKSVSEAVSSDLFPQITGELINAKVIEGYKTVNTIGDRLVTVVPAKHKTETYAGFTAADMPDEVPEGSEYNDSLIDEKYVTVPHTKYGRIISITEEMIYFDQTGQIIMRAQRIGEKAAQYRERLIVEGVQDVNSNVFRPDGVATAYYRTTASGNRKVNSVSSNPFGEAGLREIFKLMHNQIDENGDYVLIDPSNAILLTPFDLWVEAVQMQKSTLVPEGTENAVNIWKGAFTPLTSPYITAQSTTTWYLGDFRADFVWSEVWPLQTFTSKPGNEDEFNKDIKSKHKVRFYGQVAALDDKHGYKATA